MATRFNKRQTLFFIIVAIVAVTVLSYAPIVHNGFVNYDDNQYVFNNPNVKGGITQQSIIWAFTNLNISYWHPLTWLSHMLDCEIYGLRPLGHHITSILIHIINSVLLFLLLSKMTGTVWRSGFVAAAFALHPIHVESVAWVAERKDVLSGLFWILSMLAYVHYAERPNVRRYAIVLLTFVMGLMSKPMMVTLPFALLLLDYWPLDRFILRQDKTTSPADISIICQKASVWRLLAEKVPMFVLSAVVSVITFVAQKQVGVVASIEAMPLHIRAINALGSYYHYIIKMLYPKDLAVLYPPPMQVTTDAAIIAVMGIAVLLVLWGRGRRWLVMGLLWYLGTLVPVIGLVQSGFQIMADRYTYIPSIGVFIIIAWGSAEIFAKLSHPKLPAAAAGAGILIVMAVMTYIQVSYWRDSTTLFEHAIAVTKNNYTIHYNYGLDLLEQRKYEEALQHFKEASRICPQYLEARGNICITLLAQKRFDEAIGCFTDMIKERNDWPETYKMYSGLGWAYEQKGELALAETNFRKALMLKPDYQSAQNGLKSVLTKQGRRTESGNPEF
jgi:Tfp pilus assembly protein PilF